MKKFVSVLVAALFAAVSVNALAAKHMAAEKGAKDEKKEMKKEAAKKEGGIVISAPSGGLWRDLLMTFNKDYPEIKMEITPGAGPDFWARVAKERGWEVRTFQRPVRLRDRLPNPPRTPTIAAAGERGAPRSLELEVEPNAVGCDQFAEEQGPAVTESGRVPAELVTGVGLGDRRRVGGHRVAGQDRHGAALLAHRLGQLAHDRPPGLHVVDAVVGHPFAVR